MSKELLQCDNEFCELPKHIDKLEAEIEELKRHKENSIALCVGMDKKNDKLKAENEELMGLLTIKKGKQLRKALKKCVDELEHQKVLWGLATEDLNNLDDRLCRVRFVEFHNVIGDIDKAIKSANPFIGKG